MAYTNDLNKRINERFSKMSKGQRMIATFILEHIEEASFMTADALGNTVNVSESTVVRFASSLGYKGYPEFQKALMEIVKEKINNAPATNVILDDYKKEDRNIFQDVIKADIEKLEATYKEIDEEVYNLAIETIQKSKKIYVIGLRSCAPLAEFLSFYLKLIFPNVITLTSNSSSEIFEQMIRISKDDCIIGISFPRYSMRTLKALQFANSKNAKVITITDSAHSPINLYSLCNILAKSNMTTTIDSLVAPLSVINALLVGLINNNKKTVIKTLDELERVWDDYQVDGSDEIDLIDESIQYRYRKPE